MEYATILVEQRNSILRITLNRPEVLNALNFQVIGEMESALQACSQDSEVRVVVLAGAGRAFCAGDDLKGMDVPGYPAPKDDLTRLREGYPRLLRALRHLQKPVVAMVHGYALGAGCDLVLACDFAVASKDARLGLVFVQRGIASGTALLPQQIPYHKACELLLLGDMISASEAERIGLVNRVVPQDKLEGAVQELVEQLAQGPTTVIGLIKKAINEGLYRGLDEALNYQVLATLQASETDDHREGRQAFIEKRQPRYTGR